MDANRRSENEDFPVRDTSVNKIIRREMNGGSMKSALNHQAISKIDRVELEEKYLNLYDENIVLKKYGRKRDEEIKRLCAIQARLENDRKKLMSEPSGKRPADASYLQQIEQLNDKIFQLEKTNEALKMKLTVLKQQNVMSQTTLSTYPHIPSKIDSGVQKQYVDPRIIKNIRMIIRPDSSHGPRTPKVSTTEASNQIDFNSTPKISNGFNVQRAELERLMSENGKRSEEYEKVIADLKEKIRISEDNYEAELSQLRLRLNEDQKNNVKENVDRIKLEREIKEKSIKFQQLHDQFSGLQEKMNLMKRSNEQAVTEIEELQEDLKVERSKVANLQKQVESGKSNKMLLMEQQARVSDLERECEILKESNGRLMSNALDVEKENQWKKREAAFRLQISQLEAAMQADVGDKGNLLERMTQVKDELEKVRCELREYKAKNEGLLRKNEELTEKTSVFGEDGAFTNEEFTEALSIVKRRRQKEALVACGAELDFLQETDQNPPCNVDMEKQLREAEARQTETANELEKTRNLLVVQYKINNDYKNELEITNKKMEESKREFDAQLDKYAQLLDIRAERIRKLETQLKDIAYGTKQYKIDTEDRMATYRDEEDNADLMLENGQNLFEVHIKSLMLTEDCLKILSDSNPSMFCTWEFYDFELQSTPILQGPRMDYQFTSQYVVQVDDFFIHYLQKDSCLIELHQCLGSDYRTLAAGRIRLNGLLERSSGRIHGTLNLIATESCHEGTSLGVLEYWVRLRVPMEQALRLYKERSKALGYLESNGKPSPPITPLDQSAARRPPNNINHLTINIKSCRNVKATSCEAKQPSCYVVYKFYDFPDHDTSIIHSSNDPFFDDKRTYPVAMTSQLESYLKTQVLKAYLFDDTDPNVDSYLGVASIPLVTLSQDGRISGEFEVTDKDGNPNGTMEVLMTWKFSYLTSQRVQTPPTLQKPDQFKRKSKSCKASSGDAKAATPVTDSPSSVPRISSGLPDLEAERKSQSRKTSSGDAKAAMPIADDPSEPLNLKKSPRSVSPGSERGSSTSGREVEPGSLTMSSKEQAYDNENQNAGEFGESDEDAEDQTQRGKSHQTTSPPNATGESQGLDTNQNIGRTFTKQGSQSDDSDVVVPSKRPSQKTPEDTVTITISHVKLSQDSPLLKNAGIQKLFVAYEFFGVPPEQTETPFSLPKPTQPDKAISFNFTRTFSVSQEENLERRYFLATMLMREGVDGGRLRFTLISEPFDDEGDCDDVGVAFVSLPQILEEEKDVLEKDIPIHVSSTDTTVVGYMGLTVQCLETLRNIHQEMQRTSIAE